MRKEESGGGEQPCLRGRGTDHSRGVRCQAAKSARQTSTSTERAKASQGALSPPTQRPRGPLRRIWLLGSVVHRASSLYLDGQQTDPTEFEADHQHKQWPGRVVGAVVQRCRWRASRSDAKMTRCHTTSLYLTDPPAKWSWVCGRPRGSCASINELLLPRSRSRYTPRRPVCRRGPVRRRARGPGGGLSSTGRAADCGSAGYGFDPRRPPQLFPRDMAPSRPPGGIDLSPP